MCKVSIVECDCGILDEQLGTISKTYAAKAFGKICLNCSEKIRVHVRDLPKETDLDPISLSEIGI